MNEEKDEDSINECGEENVKMMFESMNIDLFVKFVLFYSEILKRVALKQIGLNNTLLISLISHVVQKMLESSTDLDENVSGF